MEPRLKALRQPANEITQFALSLSTSEMSMECSYSAAEHRRLLAGTHFPSHQGYEAEWAWVADYTPGRILGSPITVLTEVDVE